MNSWEFTRFMGIYDNSHGICEDWICKDLFRISNDSWGFVRPLLLRSSPELKATCKVPYLGQVQYEMVDFLYIEIGPVII